MKKVENFDMICAGRIEVLFSGASDNNIKVNNDSSTMYKVIDDKTNIVVAYFMGYEQAANFDRNYNHNTILPKFVIGDSGLYEEADCYDL